VHGELASAIGHRGQNVRLASQLTGWKINVTNEKESARNRRREARRLVKSFLQELHVGEDVAAVLVEAGFSSLDEVEAVCMRQLLSLRTTDDALIHELSGHVTDALLTHAIAVEERRLQAEAAEGDQSCQPVCAVTAFQ
jgi:N utilization substance protein A